MILYIIIAVVIIVIVDAFICAPEGYKDESGYHEGKPDLRIMDKSTKKEV